MQYKNSMAPMLISNASCLITCTGSRQKIRVYGRIQRSGFNSRFITCNAISKIPLYFNLLQITPKLDVRIAQKEIAWQKQTWVKKITPLSQNGMFKEF
jgi:hypothetical protein